MNDVLTNTTQNNLWVKIGLIAFISILLMIPMSHINSLIDERYQFGEIAKQEVAQKWSKSQIAGGVILSVPVIETTETKSEKGKITISEEKKFAHFLPNEIKIKADTKSIVRKRGIYKVPLYESNIQISGDFEKIKIQKLPGSSKKIKVLWGDAVLSTGVKEVRGLKKVEIKWGEITANKKLATDVGEMPSGLFSSAVNAKELDAISLRKSGKGSFYIDLVLRGSANLEFYPLGNTTEVEMTSNWGAPSFKGAYLPENHEIDDKKFQAKWKVLGLTRNLPKKWYGYKSFSDILSASKFGVDLHMPLQHYQLNTRAVKYALLFILLTFITMFFIEVIYKIKFHPMQYGMVGGSLVLFYLLLLSLSEHLGFGASYGVASIATVLSITVYVLGITKNKKWSGLVVAQLSLLYGFLFVLLNLESFTLVVGALGLWIILTAIMFITRKIDWFQISQTEKREVI